MNKRVLKTTIFLCWGFLVAFALLKTVWAEQFAIAISNPRIIEVGNYITNHKWLYYTCHMINTLLTYHFYLCACCKVWHLSWKQYLLCLIPVVVTFIITIYMPQVGMPLGYVIMFTIPYFLKASYKQVVIIYATHIIGQVLIAFIRSQPIDILMVNFATQEICIIDAFVWLLLYYLYSNLYKEDLIMGTAMPPVWGKMGKQIEQEIAKIDKKLATETNPDKIEKLKAKKYEYESMLEDSSEK